MFKKIVIGVLAVGLIAGGLIWLTNGSDSEPTSTESNPSQSNSQPVTEEASSSGAQYAMYSEVELANEYDRHIIFFHASWCPECRAFEQELSQTGAIPAGVQILETDYDTSTELKQKYGVTLQSTFVEVDEDGNLIAKWSGYGQGKSFSDIETGLSES